MTRGPLDLSVAEAVIFPLSGWRPTECRGRVRSVAQQNDVFRHDTAVYWREASRSHGWPRIIMVPRPHDRKGGRSPRPSAMARWLTWGTRQRQMPHVRREV
jgi:hypothetical protein